MSLLCAWLTRYRYTNVGQCSVLFGSDCDSLQCGVLHWLILKRQYGTECLSALVFLKQGRKGNRGCMWSSPVRGKSWWRIDLAACSKELSAGTFNYRGDWFWPWSPPRLVFISNCRLTVKQHYQRRHPKPKPLVYQSSRGPDYHSVSGMWATVALFLLTNPLPPLPPSLLRFSLSFKYLSAHVKKKKKLMSSAHATCSISDKSEPAASAWESSY